MLFAKICKYHKGLEHLWIWVFAGSTGTNLWIRRDNYKYLYGEMHCMIEMYTNEAAPHFNSAGCANRPHRKIFFCQLKGRKAFLSRNCSWCKETKSGLPVSGNYRWGSELELGFLLYFSLGRLLLTSSDGVARCCWPFLSVPFNVTCELSCNDYTSQGRGLKHLCLTPYPYSKSQISQCIPCYSELIFQTNLLFSFISQSKAPG